MRWFILLIYKHEYYHQPTVCRIASIVPYGILLVGKGGNFTKAYLWLLCDKVCLFSILDA